MRSSAHIEGHPIHPMLVGFPVAYLFGSACINLFARATNRPRWFRTAAHLNALGIAAALAAAVPGLVDYVFAIPPKSSARKRATNHMFANLSALGLFTLARLGRRRRDEDAPPTDFSIAAGLAGMGLMTAGGWMGGTLVFRNQIGVDHRYANAGKWRLDVAPRIGATIVAAASGELKVDQMKLIRAGARRLVAARTEQGYAAFDDRCTHKGGPLSDGALVCGTVQCPWHGSQFDVMTGRVKQGPATEPIATYPVAETDSGVCIELDERLKS